MRRDRYVTQLWPSKAFRDREFSPRKRGSAEIRNDHSVPAYDGLFYLIPTGCTTPKMAVRFSAEMKRKHFITDKLTLLLQEPAALTSGDSSGNTTLFPIKTLLV